MTPEAFFLGARSARSGNVYASVLENHLVVRTGADGVLHKRLKTDHIDLYFVHMDDAAEWRYGSLTGIINTHSQPTRGLQ
jgi:hypothetical protein